MQAHILSLHTHTSAYGAGSIGQDICFLKVVNHIKLKGIEHRASCTQHIFFPYTHPLPIGLGQKVKTFFSESTHAANQIKGNGALKTMHAHILSLYTLSVPGVGSKGQNMFL